MTLLKGTGPLSRIGRSGQHRPPGIFPGPDGKVPKSQRVQSPGCPVYPDCHHSAV